MNTVDLGFWVVLAAGIAIGIAWERRVAVAEWLVGLLDEEPSRPAVLPRSHPSVRVLHGPYDYERDGSA